MIGSWLERSQIDLAPAGGEARYPGVQKISTTPNSSVERAKDAIRRWSHKRMAFSAAEK